MRIVVGLNISGGIIFIIGPGFFEEKCTGNQKEYFRSFLNQIPVYACIRIWCMHHGASVIHKATILALPSLVRVLDW